MKQKLANAIKLMDVQVSKYDVIFYVGGHGPVLDLAQSPVNAKLASEVRYLYSYTRFLHTKLFDLTNLSLSQVLPGRQDHFGSMPRSSVSFFRRCLYHLLLWLRDFQCSRRGKGQRWQLYLQRQKLHRVLKCRRRTSQESRRE